jgi:hypothetical protein
MLFRAIVTITLAISFAGVDRSAGGIVLLMSAESAHSGQSAQGRENPADQRQRDQRRLPEENPKNLLARLSYDSTYVAEEKGQPHFSRLCFEVYRDGRYRISRMALGRTENLGGTISQDEVSHVADLLKKVDFENKGGGIVRRGSETFVAEIMREGRSARYIWVDPDHRRAFPRAAQDLIEWLQDFKAQGARPLTAPEVSTMQICPRMTDTPLQPVAARGAECLAVSGN